MTNGRALVVDDDPDILEVLEMRLQSMGLDVALARSHRDAISLLDGRGFDVALFDLRMEPLSGLQLMEAAHQRQPRLPVLIMTAHGTIDNAVEALREGAFDYLTKPFVPEELRGKVGRALSQRRWTRDRTLLRAVGEALGSSGTMERVLDTVAHATVEATEAERAVVFLLEEGRLVPMGGARQVVDETDGGHGPGRARAAGCAALRRRRRCGRSRGGDAGGARAGRPRSPRALLLAGGGGSQEHSRAGAPA